MQVAALQRLAGPSAGGGVGVGGELGGGLFAELDVPAEAAQVRMPGLGLELGRGAPVGRQVLEGGVPQLVERPAGAGLMRSWASGPWMPMVMAVSVAWKVVWRPSTATRAAAWILPRSRMSLRWSMVWFKPSMVR
ncbi:hypothetical protein [Streptosporangium roseum]|uniref:hypothetical protein n=1 Tax=Streptosporangium roseum TaxID=2001 RepID=UPI003321035A